MPLLNYSTRVEAHRTVSEINSILIKHGASRIMQDYDENGNIVALKWSLVGPYGVLGYAMPLNYESVYELLTKEGRIFTRDTEKRKAQARRVAWRILKDWIEAQIALLETGMVEMEEIFLPYMLGSSNGKTLYDTLAENDFQKTAFALPSPQEQR